MTSLRAANTCGSTDPAHRWTKCHQCNANYQRAYRASKRRVGPAPDAPACTFCGVLQGNTHGRKVYQYALIRPVRIRRGYSTNKCIASIAICDGCLVKQTIPSPSYAKAHGLTERKWPAVRAIDSGLRANDGMPSSLGS